MPGLAATEIELSVVGDELTIEGERAPLDFAEGTTVHRRERRVGAFSRIVELPVGVKDDAVTAEFSNGILTITLPKTDADRSRHIPVRTHEA